MTWSEWQSSREAKRAALRKHGCEAPSRRSVSFNTSEAFMREAFGGGRVPAWAAAGNRTGCLVSPVSPVSQPI